MSPERTPGGNGSTNGAGTNGAAHGDERVHGLARELERLARRHAAQETALGELDGLVRRLGEDVAALAADLATDDDQPPLATWLEVDDEHRAHDLLTDLADWLARVYTRYPDGTLPSCWAWHPAVVEELWWLRQAHRAAHDGPRASWREVADWHDRHRPATVARLRDAIGGCELDRHRPGADRHHEHERDVPLRDALDAIARHWVTGRATPEPSREQLTEAWAHDQTQHRRRR